MGMATTESQFHVLAVDDNIIDRKLIERLLKTSSYQVTTVDSGSKALELLGFHQVDETNPNPPSISTNNHQDVEVNLVITDYCMPGMTGYDLLKRIKESSSLRNIPVVIMSSENVPSRINRCLEEGAEEFFLKPVRLSDVNKLRPHMMKTKSKDQNQIHEHKQEFKDEYGSSDMPGIRSYVKEHDHLQPEQETTQQQQQQQQLNSSTNNNNKRKVMEERLSPDRTRPRLDGITTMV